MAENQAERGRGVGARARAAGAEAEGRGLESAERHRLAAAFGERRPAWGRIVPTHGRVPGGRAMAGEFQAWPVNGVPGPSPAPGDADRELTELTLSPPGERARRARRGKNAGGGAANMVKCMDGRRYMRKVDVAGDGDYHELAQELNAMFGCCSIGLKDGYGVWEHTVAYQDADGDWMLIGDLPWEMFVRSCRRMRVMPACEAIGPSANA